MKERIELAIGDCVTGGNEGQLSMRDANGIKFRYRLV